MYTNKLHYEKTRETDHPEKGWDSKGKDCWSHQAFSLCSGSVSSPDPLSFVSSMSVADFSCISFLLTQTANLSCWVSGRSYARAGFLVYNREGRTHTFDLVRSLDDGVDCLGYGSEISKSHTITLIGVAGWTGFWSNRSHFFKLKLLSSRNFNLVVVFLHMFLLYQIVGQNHFPLIIHKIFEKTIKFFNI